MFTAADLAAATNAAVDEIIRYVRATPEDRRTWSPLDAGRTMMSQLQECAVATDFFLQHIDLAYTPKYRSMDEAYAAMAGLNTVDACEAELRSQTALLTARLVALPSEEWDREVTMPWGKKEKLRTVAFYHYGNLTYHVGQIAYIQTLYGDKDSH